MTDTLGTRETVERITRTLWAYCEVNDWAGYEPYDALNSRVLEGLSFLDSRIPRLVLTQALKRSPVNMRRPLGIPRTQNPKALGLFLTAFTKLARLGVVDAERQMELMVERLLILRSQRSSYWCWGYNFPWQTRTVLVPRWQPNLVCTSFAGFGILDAFELTGDPRLLEIARSAAKFLLDELYWTDGNAKCGFGYPLPLVRNQVHNANLLAADLLIRVYKLTGDGRLLSPALNATRYSVSQQHSDGGWDYGESSTQKWIDNFHTGFNLSALQSIARCLETAEFLESIERGIAFYRAHFFRSDGAVSYYHDRMYPIDTHCVAQSIITLVDLKEFASDNIALAMRVLQWAVRHMWDEDRGLFYYRMVRLCTIRTSYMRWTQAWMFLALATLWTEMAAAESNTKSAPAASTRLASC